MLILDNKKIEEFSGKMVGILNTSYLAIMISIGNRTGLFDSLSKMDPSTSNQIAQYSGLNERYVKEWCNAMVVGKIIDYDSKNNLYTLPKEHAQVLTKEAGIRNLAFFTEGLKTVAAVEDQIVDNFKNGGGVSYENPHVIAFLNWWNTYTSQFFDATLISDILPLMPTVVSDLKKGIKILDVGCGYGHSTNLIAKSSPNSTITGYDFSKKGIQAAKDESRKLGLKNVKFELKNIEELGGSEKFNLITAFDCIHDQAKPGVVLKVIANSLADDGTFLMVDIKASTYVENNMDLPAAPMLYSTSTLHCMSVSLGRDGLGLGNMWGKEKAVSMLKDAGFTNINVKEVEGDIFNYYYVSKIK